MSKHLSSQKIFRSVYTVLKRQTGMMPDVLAPTSNISQWFDGDPGACQSFVRDLEARIGIDIDDSAVAQSETFQDLCEWCARRSEALAETHRRHDGEDDEDEYVWMRRRQVLMKKVILPLFCGLLVSVVAVAVVWWRKGCPKFW